MDNTDRSLGLQVYENWADEYSEVVNTSPFNLYYERPAMLKLLPCVAGQTVLDAGCASGWYSEWLAGKGATVTGIDITPRMIELAQARLGDTAKIIRADLAEPLDFLATSSFDIVVSSLTLHYVESWDIAFAEFHRILRDSGRLIFSVLHPFNPAFAKQDDYFSMRPVEIQWSSCLDPPVTVTVYKRSLSDMVAALQTAGFRISDMVEPQPTEECRAEFNDIYTNLMKRPRFICVAATTH